mmetsp:Transcript_39590/g.60548  ORF Transcript_39590/g.60548 Transcript_39590/m.60548 type:complete len:158 (-) Transcript_39590:1329-1802(-)
MKANQQKIREMANKKLRFQEKKTSETMYSTILRDGQVIPSFVLNSPNYKKIHKLSMEAEQMSDEFYKYCDYLIRVRKMIDETKKEIEDEDKLIKEVMSKREALSRSPQKTSPRKPSFSQKGITPHKSPSSRTSSQILNIQFSVRREGEDDLPPAKES